MRQNNTLKEVANLLKFGSSFSLEYTAKFEEDCKQLEADKEFYKKLI